MSRISRREFLKLLAAGGIVAAGSMFGLGNFVAPRGSGTRATAQSAGSWSPGPTTLSHPVHLALLRNGKVLYVAGSGYNTGAAKTGPFKAGVWNPSNNNQTEYLMDEDLFCCGHTVLQNGNILLVGGTLMYKFESPSSEWLGLDAAYEFDVQSEDFLTRPSIAHGRWYPTLVLLPDGKVQVVAGFDEFGEHNLLNEIYNPSSQSWSIMYDPNASRTYCAGAQCYGGANSGVNPGLGLYPRMHLMPSGLVALVGQTDAYRVWDPETGKWYSAGTGTRRSYGTSVLLPLQNTSGEAGKILSCAGSPTSSPPIVATNSAEVIEPNGFSLSSRSIPSMKYARRYCSSVILPTGKVVVIGGTQGDNEDPPVLKPEMFDPDTETWSELPAHSIPKIYHSGALLLKDGRVWAVGSSYSNIEFELDTEIYSPDYVFATRPTISGSPSGGVYGGTISIPTPNAGNITSVSLVRVSSTTHHYNTDQRLIWLQILSKISNTVTVSAPMNSNIAPPGYYLIHVLDGGVPSIGAFIQIGTQQSQVVFYDVPSPGDSFAQLKTGGDTRAGEEAKTGSQLIGKSLKKWTVYLRKRFTPSGSITAVVRRKSDDAVVATFAETLATSNLQQSFQPFEFTLSTPYVIQLNDRILVQYSGPSRVDVESWNSDKFDGAATRRVKFNSGTGKYTGSFQDTKDIVGKMSSQ